jgi:hypothetical protein
VPPGPEGKPARRDPGVFSFAGGVFALFCLDNSLTLSITKLRRSLNFHHYPAFNAGLGKGVPQGAVKRPCLSMGNERALRIEGLSYKNLTESEEEP